MNILKPPPLRRGDTIGIVVPAGPIDPKRIDRALDRFHDRGFPTKSYGDIARASGYLAGDDKTRAREFIEAFEDPETSGVWCARGGYGVVRILELIDFDVIRRHPKVFVGFSDITAMHLAIEQRVGLVTFHGPNLQDGFGVEEEMLPATEAALWQAVMGDEDGIDNTGYILRASDAPTHAQAISPGVAIGRLTGGNLAILCGLMGTPYEIETGGCILFLEDVDEAPYRIDRYMAQLRLAGKLRAAAGILLGSFTDDAMDSDRDAEIFDLLAHYCGDLGLPVLAGFPSGHRRENWTLPMGALVELDADQKLLRIL